MKLVLSSPSLAWYPNGGGHWSARLQSMLGFRAMGCDVHWLSVLALPADEDLRNRYARAFFETFARFDLAENAVLLAADQHEDQIDINNSTVYSKKSIDLDELCSSADAVINFVGKLTSPILDRFGKKVFIDLDPGHLQASYESVYSKGNAHPRFQNVCKKISNLKSHDLFFTVGLNYNNENCLSPDLGVKWRPFLPPIHLPVWGPPGELPAGAPFSSVTQWNWQALTWKGRTISTSKRDGYLKYRSIPRRSGKRFCLAANFGPHDKSGNRESLQAEGWKIVDPHTMCATPESYRDFISGSLAEFGCAKPIHAELRTGWFSDRTAAYLACGRPALVEHTGFPGDVPVGEGIVTFSDFDEALAGVEDICERYARHSRRAREFAEEYLSADRALRPILEAL